MNEDRDPGLLALFAEAEQDLADDTFVTGVKTRTQRFKQKLLMGVAGMALIALAISWLFSFPVLGLAYAVTDMLAIELVPVANADIAWILSPVNNVAALMLLVYRFVRIGMNKARRASYVN